VLLINWNLKYLDFETFLSAIQHSACQSKCKAKHSSGCTFTLMHINSD
jgi:hypothetical protein